MLKKIIQLLIFVGLLTNFAFADEFDVNKFVDEYGKEVQNIVKSNLKYTGPEDAVSAVSYTIHPDGSVTDIQVKQASGTNFDKAVIEAVQKSAPFKPFPKESNLANIVMTSGFQHKVQRYQTARMSIMPVEPPEEVKQAYQKYMQKVSNYLFDRIPTIYSYIPQEPVMKCIITKDGTIKNVELTQSSGIEEYDKKIIQTYTGMKVSPFPEELKMYEELPYSATVLRQFKRRPTLGSPNYFF